MKKQFKLYWVDTLKRIVRPATKDTPVDAIHESVLISAKSPSEALQIGTRKYTIMELAMLELDIEDWYLEDRKEK